MCSLPSADHMSVFGMNQNPIPFEAETVLAAWNRQDGLCARCCKELVFDNRDEDGARGAWQAHHRQGLGSNRLRNCVVLCINGENCHFKVHGGRWTPGTGIPASELPCLRGLGED